MHRLWVQSRRAFAGLTGTVLLTESRAGAPVGGAEHPAMDTLLVMR